MIAILLVLSILFENAYLIKISNVNLKPIILDQNIDCPFGFTGKNCSYECGKSFFDFKNRQIVGGDEAIPHQFPSMCHLTIKYKFKFFGSAFFLSYQCGGSLISPNTVLTAGHCVINETSFYYSGLKFTGVVDSISVILGAHNLSSIAPGYTIQGKKITRHKSFDRFNFLNDIALIELESNVTLNEYVQLACLPNFNKTSMENSTSVIAVGWGRTSVAGTISDVLRKVNITIYNSSACNKTNNELVKDWNSQMCVGDLEGKKDTCQGDSGGPLYFKSTVANDTRYFVVGLTSYGVGCATPNIPAVYTKISYFVSWINNYLYS